MATPQRSSGGGGGSGAANSSSRHRSLSGAAQHACQTAQPAPQRSELPADVPAGLLSSAINAAVSSCVAAGMLPPVQYPDSRVAQPSLKQQRRLPGAVRRAALKYHVMKTSEFTAVLEKFTAVICIATSFGSVAIVQHGS